eukprot:CAMPEP_0119425134 /NCGR_PEP_ID=MMETSP1335-20130426/33930_1 /TAXON_ID=259385 /ORGANISM="Chrysoculter rhomboideus, Strain RCC1486" /LENGTH=106 /DNA_ID=CAMNT_0007450687 /DNA_START=39 /DNA_END=360 /DNA_ORIENTATION=+
MTRDVETASSAHSSQQGRTTEWITMGSEVRGVSVDAGTAALLHEHDTQRPCATLLDRYVACVQEYNIELCDDEKFLYGSAFVSLYSSNGIQEAAQADEMPQRGNLK